LSGLDDRKVRKVGAVIIGRTELKYETERERERGGQTDRQKKTVYLTKPSIYKITYVASSIDEWNMFMEVSRNDTEVNGIIRRKTRRCTLLFAINPTITNSSARPN
jgi:hypothetical protein